MKQRFVVSSVVVLLGMLLCGTSLAADVPKVVTERVAHAKAIVKQVDMVTFRKLLDKKGNALIIDVREPEEYRSGYIPGAVNIPRGKLEFNIWPYVGYPDKLDTSRTLYIYCATAARSALATETLTQLGFKNAYLVNMQLEDWKKAGYPLEEEGL
jgi:rhodanese-related sulfurtransferase